MTENDIKFERLATEARHSELLGALSEMTRHLQKPNDTSIQDALARQLKVLEGLVNIIMSAPKPVTPAAPIVNISSNHDKILTEVQHIAQNMAAQLSELNKPREWSFSFMRDRNGFISSPIDIKSNG